MQVTTAGERTRPPRAAAALCTALLAVACETPQPDCQLIRMQFMLLLPAEGRMQQHT